MTQLENYLQHLQRFGIQPGLERIRALLQSAGNPQTKYPLVLVGGTNGKGSTCEFLAKLLQADGKRTGLYTSPHLYRWNERIRVLENRKPETGNELFEGAISDSELDALFNDALPHIEKVAAAELGQPTEFEVLTFLGLWHFARAQVDAAVIEVGLGGKWDATNATEPTISVITHVALDHCDRLGNTVEEIARDKVEIARAGRVLVTAETKPEVLQVFREYCLGIRCEVRGARCERDDDFQKMNFQTAYAAYEVLCEILGWQQNSKFKIQNSKLQVPGRFEIIRQNPTVILDGANNPDGASTLAQRLRATLEENSDAKLILVLGILLDKDWRAMTGVLASLAEVVIATQSHSPRAADKELVAEEARKFCSRVETSPSPQVALQRALEVARPQDIICVTGSFYTIAEIERE